MELGSLSKGRRRKDGSLGNPQGEITVMIDFDWRVERVRSILGGSHDSKVRCINISKKLIGAAVISAQIVGRLPELQIELSSRLWVVTFSHEKGQPSWTILFKKLGIGSLNVKNGTLNFDRRIS